MLLLSSIIPISLRVNLDLAKIWYSWLIGFDKDIAGSIARNSTIPEELGRIQCLLTDKTGTLTQNDMTLKKIAMEYTQFTSENTEDLQEFLVKNCEAHDGPLGDFAHVRSEQSLEGRRRKRRELEFSVRDLATALVVCHNVTPMYNESGEREFQASSPDEIALVRFGDSLQMQLVQRDDKVTVIENPTKQREEFEILANFPFSSETKRMGIIVRHVSSGRIIFYMKGAEVVMEKKVKPSQRTALMEACENLAM